MLRYELWVDGSCPKPHGCGGWAYVLIAGDGLFHLRYSGGAPSTTNCRMEMEAVIQGLACTPPGAKVIVYSDAKYVTEAFNAGWLRRWKMTRWRNATRKPVANQDLWQRLDAIVQGRDIAWIHIKGHAGVHWNEVCDKLAGAATQQMIAELRQHRTVG